MLIFKSFFQLGLVCFRLKASNKINEKLLSQINESGKLHMVPANVNEKYVIRFCVVAQHATEADIGKQFFRLRIRYVTISQLRKLIIFFSCLILSLFIFFFVLCAIYFVFF